MVLLVRDRDLREVQGLPFCYACGAAFKERDETNDDHVPAKTVFKVSDRRPLILRTHKDCNCGNNLEDEKIGQLIRLRHSPPPLDPRNRRLKWQASPRSGRVALVNVDIDGIVWRWVRGFHAALYREPFPPFTPAQFKPAALHHPFPRVRVVGNDLMPELPRQQVLSFVETVKANRLRQNVDRIQCNNGKLRYECVWVETDEGAWMCVFALDLYGWRDLGKVPGVPNHGCVGMYLPPSGVVPTCATIGKRSPIITPNLDPLDAFAP